MEKRFAKFTARGLLALLLALALAAPGFALERTLLPLGRAVGIELRTPGALVVGLAADGSPAGDAGVRAGDLITEVDGQRVGSAEDFAAALSGAGERVTLTLTRGGRTLRLEVEPEAAPEGKKLGLWLRSGISGIGTVTFVDPETGWFGALGHPVSDAETNLPLPLGSGRISAAEIVAVRRGEGGLPGELCGSFDAARAVGTVEKNTDCGLFGYLEDWEAGEALPVAAESEIVPGAATILCSVEGSAVAEYAVRIEQVRRGDMRTLCFRVEDEALLARTGGIVQGMSGSPILQGGRLVGAVTHVFVADPTRGYGVSIERMLRAGEEMEN